MVFECSEGMRRGRITEQEWCVDAPAKLSRENRTDRGLRWLDFVDQHAVVDARLEAAAGENHDAISGTQTAVFLAPGVDVPEQRVGIVGGRFGQWGNAPAETHSSYDRRIVAGTQNRHVAAPFGQHPGCAAGAGGNDEISGVDIGRDANGSSDDGPSDHVDMLLDGLGGDLRDGQTFAM